MQAVLPRRSLAVGRPSPTKCIVISAATMSRRGRIVVAPGVVAAGRTHRAATNAAKHPRRIAVPVASAAAVDPRETLRVAIANQLTGAHFDTWLDPSRFHPNMVVMQARRLWYYATLMAPGALACEGEFSAERLAQLRTAAAAAFQNLCSFRRADGDGGGWLFSTHGVPQVHMYGVIFALYALSTYYNITHDERVRSLADRTFDEIYDRRAADGGVFPEAYEPDFSSELRQPQNALGHFKGRRTVNTHIHTVEGLTAYHVFIARSCGDEERARRSAGALRAITDLVVAMKDGPRILELRDAADATRPAANLAPGEQVMFLPGHNVETTFLVHDAYDALGLPGPPASFTVDMLEEAHSRMALGPGGEVWLPHIFVRQPDGSWKVGTKEWEAEVNWWAQMELLNALVHADQRLGGPGGKGDEYIQRALQTWQLVASRFVSPETGALYETLDRKTFKGQGPGWGPWKASYHTSRALVRSLQALCAAPAAPAA